MAHIERKGGSIYVDGKKTFKFWYEGEGTFRPDVTYKPAISYRQFKAIKGTVTELEYERQMKDWFEEFTEFDKEQCIEMLRKKACLEEVRELNREAALSLDGTIKYKCKHDKDYSLYW